MKKILDLGAHDGFVSLWLARRMRDLGVRIRVDGAELNSQAVAVARDRFGAEGIPGRFYVCAAEDAPAHFAPGTYDMVLCFELLEHVLDTDRLLAAAERMCAPGGLVLVSTPNGTFGAGDNPHHLRTWTLGSLIELLRRRGEIIQALPGDDGISTVAYRPAARTGVAVIHAGAGWKPWRPADMESPGGLGGSETAAARVGEALASEGWIATVLGSVERGFWKGVATEWHEAWDPDEEVDLLVCSRVPEMSDAEPKAVRSVLWMHDVDYGDRLTPERAERFDAIGVLSEWHAQHVLYRYPWLDRGKLTLVPNGINPAYFEDLDSERNPHRAIFTSSPDRGLDFLLRIWPRVRQLVPDAELAHCYADVYDHMATMDMGLAAFRRKLRALGAATDGIVELGPQSQPGVAVEMARSALWLAPSWNGQYHCRFHETYCIGALEATAAGCSKIMSNWGALSERSEQLGGTLLGSRTSYVKQDDFKVPGDGAPPDEDEWVGAIADALLGRSSPAPLDATRQLAMEQTWALTAKALAGR